MVEFQLKYKIQKNVIKMEFRLQQINPIYTPLVGIIFLKYEIYILIGVMP